MNKELQKRKNKAAEKAYRLMLEIPRGKYNNPLTMEGCIRNLILKCSDWCPYRESALNLLYCVLGTGIEWDKGRLCDNNPNGYLDTPPAAGGQGVWARDFGMDDSVEILLKGLPKDVAEKLRDENLDWERKILERAIETVEDVDNRCKNYRPGPQSWYPISWYACRLCVPEDAQLDFLEGAVETTELILMNDLPPNTQKWIDDLRNKAYAARIMPFLQARRGTP